MPGRAPAQIHMVCESCSLWHFYEGYVYVPFIFILLVLIAVYWTLLLWTHTTCFPDTAPAAVCHMGLLSSDKNLLLSDHNSWECSALRSLSCWDSNWAMWHSRQTQEMSGSSGGRLWQLKTSHVLLNVGFTFGTDCGVSHRHFLGGKHWTEDSKRFKRDMTSISLLTIRFSPGFLIIFFSA